MTKFLLGVYVLNTLPDNFFESFLNYFVEKFWYMHCWCTTVL